MVVYVLLFDYPRNYGMQTTRLQTATLRPQTMQLCHAMLCNEDDAFVQYEIDGI